MAVRLGAIYALERISRDSPRDHWTIIETLTAYLRDHAPWPPPQALANPFVQLQGSTRDGMDSESISAEEPKDAPAQIRPATDVQAVLTVLGRRDKRARKHNVLDLGATDLRGADLRLAHLEGALLCGVHLEDANLRGAHLEGAFLYDAHLEFATLWSARLYRAHLEGAHLEGADLRGLTPSDLGYTRFFKNVNFLRHSIGPARGLTQEQVNTAKGSEETMLPAELTPPPHWSAASSNDRPDGFAHLQIAD